MYWSSRLPALCLLLLAGHSWLAAGQTAGEESPCAGCVHGACALDEDTEQYTCTCLAGWTGLACNTSSAPAPAPAATSACGTCVHGTCAHGYNTQSYVCQCLAGWSGLACNVSTAPAPAPTYTSVIGNSSACTPGCANNGLCQLLSTGSSVCDCTGTGYSGSTCSLSSTTASTPFGSSRDPGCEGCANGAKCVEDANSQTYYCECSGTGYTGVNCTVSASAAAAAGAPPPPSAAVVEQEDSKAGAAVPKSLDAGAVAGIILAVAVVLGLAVIGVMLWRQPRRNGPKFERYTSDTEIPSSVSSKASLR